MQDLEQLAAGFNASQGRKVSATPHDGGVGLLAIHDGHVDVGATRQTIMVPMPADAQGVQNDQGFPLWPPMANNLTGAALSTAVRGVLAQLAWQGQIGDCWMLSAVFSIVEANYAVITSRVVVLPNGNIGLYCWIGGDVNKPVTLECTFTLPNIGSALGPGHYVAMKAIELLMAFGRYMSESQNGTVTTPIDTMQDLDSGWMWSMYQLLGIPCTQVAATLTNIAAALGSGKAVTFGTPGTTTNGYVTGHAYSVFRDYAANPVTDFAINPWGNQGAAWGNPMYIPIQGADIANYGGTLVVADPANALPVPVPARIPGDANGDGIVDGGDFDAWFTHLQVDTTKMPVGTRYTVGDFNEDGLVDGGDFDIWLRNLSVTSTGAAAGTWTDTQKASLAKQVSVAAFAKLFPSHPHPNPPHPNWGPI